ncbi:MAG: hypothetical protein K8R25_15085, partial [Methanosarcinales archaeon]|nr:hypothetical protein [Methanosarcinales archaeon]
MKQSKNNNRIISVLITFLVIIMLIISNPAGAIIVDMDMDNMKDLKVGDTGYFYFNVTIGGNERIPIANFTIGGLPEITGSPGGILLFNVSDIGTTAGNNKSKGNYDIELVKIYGWTSGSSSYGYQYNYNAPPYLGYGYNTQFSGYGYGYGSSSTQYTQLAYKITVNTSGASSGDFNVIGKVNTGDSGEPHFSSTTSSFTLAAGSAATITVTANPSPIVANDIQLSTITATVKDAYGNNVTDGTIISFQTNRTNDTLSAITDTTTNGVASITVRGNKTGVSNITASKGSASGSYYITMIAGPSASITVSANPSSIVANDTQLSTITSTVEDAYGNKVEDGTIINFQTNRTNNDTLSAFTDTTTNGVASITVKGNKAGVSKITASNGSASDSVNVTMIAGPSASITVSANPSSIVANNTQLSTITTTVEDAYGNKVKDGTIINFQTNRTNDTLSASTNTTTNGMASITVKGNKAGVSKITASNGSASGSYYITMIAGPVDNIAVSANPSSIVANDTQLSTITSTVEDAYGNKVEDGTIINFQTNRTNNDTLSAFTDTTTNGVASITVKGNKAGVSKITASNGSASDSVNVTMIAGPPFIVLNVSGMGQIGIENKYLQDPFVFQINDENNNPVSNKNVDFTVIGGNNSLASASTGTTNTSGQVNVTLQLGDTKGNYGIMCKINGTPTINNTITGTVIENGTISGTVTDGSTKLPIHNANVYAMNVSTGELIESDQTDSTGKYYISITPGTYTLNVSASNYDWNNQTKAVVAAGKLNSSRDVELTTQKVTLVLQSGDTPSRAAIIGNATVFNLNATNYGTDAKFTVGNSSTSATVKFNGTNPLSFVLNSGKSKKFNVTINSTAGYYPVTITLTNSTKSTSINLYATILDTSGYVNQSSHLIDGGNATGGAVLVNSNVSSNATVDASILHNSTVSGKDTIVEGGSTITYGNVTDGATVAGGSVVKHSNVTGDDSKVDNGAIIDNSTIDNSTIDSSTIVNVTAKNSTTITGVTIDTGHRIELIGATVTANSKGDAQIAKSASTVVVTRNVTFSGITSDIAIKDLIIDQSGDKTTTENTISTISDVDNCRLTVNFSQGALINISETGISPDGEGSDVDQSTVIGNFMHIQSNKTSSSAVNKITIRLYHNTSISYDKGVDIYYYNTSIHEWEKQETTNNGTSDGRTYLETEPDHFSTFVVMGVNDTPSTSTGSSSRKGSSNYWRYYGTPTPTTESEYDIQEHVTSPTKTEKEETGWGIEQTQA